MGASDSCLETSICPPAFIPDHSYEIKFNKNLFLRHQRNEIQPFLNNWTQWDRTAEDTSCSTCISQVRHPLPLRELGNTALYFSYNCARSVARASRGGAAALGSGATALFSLFNLKARLLFCRKSEILFPGRVSWLLRGEETAETERFFHQTGTGRGRN